MFELPSLRDSRFSRNAPRFPGTWYSKPSLCFRNHSLCPSQASWAWSPQALWTGLWASGSPSPCNLTCSRLCRCGPHLRRQGHGLFFFFNEKFFKFCSALQFFQKFHTHDFLSGQQASPKAGWCQSAWLWLPISGWTPLQSTLNQDCLCRTVVCFRGSVIAAPSTCLLT